MGWLHRALDEHAAQRPETRAQLAATNIAAADVPKGRGFSRTYPLRESTVAALERAIIDDRQATGRLVSRSGFLREAVQSAARRARDRYGRDLPAAPPRLPDRPLGAPPSQ